MKRHKPTAQIVQRDGQWMVRVDVEKHKVVYATRDGEGRINYNHPENVPRDMKNRVVPDLFAEIDFRLFGIRKA